MSVPEHLNQVYETTLTELVETTRQKWKRDFYFQVIPSVQLHVVNHISFLLAKKIIMRTGIFSVIDRFWESKEEKKIDQAHDNFISGLFQFKKQQEPIQASDKLLKMLNTALKQNTDPEKAVY